jgi:hypothetical protein
LSRADTLTAISALLTLIMVVVTLVVDEDALRYEPYPSITVPAVNLVLLAALSLLILPAFLAPAGDVTGEDAVR